MANYTVEMLGENSGLTHTGEEGCACPACFADRHEIELEELEIGEAEVGGPKGLSDQGPSDTAIERLSDLGLLGPGWERQMG